MKNSKVQRPADQRIMSLLKQAENSVPVADLCLEYGMRRASLSKSRSKYGGMEVSDAEHEKAV